MNLLIKEFTVELISPEKELAFKKEGETFSKTEPNSIVLAFSKKSVAWYKVIGVKYQIRTIIKIIKDKQIVQADKFFDFDFLLSHSYRGERTNARIIASIIETKRGFKRR